MKKFGAFCLLTAVALVWCCDATARAPYRVEFLKMYKDSEIAADAKKASCKNCHYGKKKKNRNDFGTALSKHLNKKLYDELKKNKPALAEKVREAVKAVLKEESFSGETFGDRIAAGKLPGTAPAE